MLVGLLRQRLDGMGQLLWKQGHIWLFLATIAEVPPTVFIGLNLNDPFNLVCFRGGLPLRVCFSSCPHHTDVSNSLTHRDVNHRNADASVFGRPR
jgi:hypothetical protein